MEFALAFFNLWAFGALLLAAGAAAALYRKVPSDRERLLHIGSFAQTAAFALSGLRAAALLASDVSLEEIGPLVRLVVAIALYGALFNLACKIWARLVKEETPGRAPPLS